MMETSSERRRRLREETTAPAIRRLLEEICRECRAEESTLWCLSEDGQALEGALNIGACPEVVEALAVPVGESVIGLVVASGQAAAIGPGDDYNRSVDEATGVTSRAMIAAPVYLGERRSIVVSAINPEDRERFPAEALEILRWKAYLLGLVIEDRHGRDL